MDKVSISREEQETILRYDAVDKQWHVYTCIRPHEKKMKELGWPVVFEDMYGTKFLAPSHAIKLCPAEKKKRDMTDEQRAEMNERMRKLREAQKNSA